MLCSWDDCRKPATLYPVLLLTPDAVHFGRGEMPELAVCASCRGSITLRDFIPNDETWDKLARTFRLRGLSAPSRVLTSVEWVPLSPEPPGDAIAPDPSPSMDGA